MGPLHFPIVVCARTAISSSHPLFSTHVADVSSVAIWDPILPIQSFPQHLVSGVNFWAVPYTSLSNKMSAEIQFAFGRNRWLAAKSASIGAIQSGSLGIQGHFANALAALYIACGQARGRQSGELVANG